MQRAFSFIAVLFLAWIPALAAAPQAGAPAGNTSPATVAPPMPPPAATLTDAQKLRVSELKVAFQQTAIKRLQAQVSGTQAELLATQAAIDAARNAAAKTALEQELLKALGARETCTFDLDALVTNCPAEAPKTEAPKKPQS